MFFRNLINWILGFMLLNLDFKYSQSNVNNHGHGNSLIKEVATIQLGSCNFDKRP